jgi:hypothetical protein
MAQQYNKRHGAKWREFDEGDEVYVKLHSNNNKWRWEPATIKKRHGFVNYDVKVNNRIVKFHVDQMKQRYTTITDEHNVLMEDFELPQPMQREIEPELQPEGEPDETTDDEDNFEDARDESSSSEDEDAQPLRRSTRATAGIPPQRLGY